jgi:hypothetical protein
MFFQTMSLIRYNYIADTPEADLNDGEKALGWHFCPMYDGLPINKNDPAFRNHRCDCAEHDFKDDDDICV